MSWGEGGSIGGHLGSVKSAKVAIKMVIITNIFVDGVHLLKFIVKNISFYLLDKKKFGL